MVKNENRYAQNEHLACLGYPMKAICMPKSIVLLAVFIVFGALIAIQAAQAPSYVENNKFKVAFEMESSLTKQILYITIENKQDSSDNLDMKTLINSVNFPADMIKNSRFYVQKKEEYEVPIYKTVCNPYNTTTEPNATYPAGLTMEHSNCTTTEIGTETRERMVWQEKSLTYKQSSNQEYKEYWENVQIQQAGQEKSILKFKLEFNTPIVETGSGWGSSGRIYIDLNGELFYDFEHSSWWDASYNYKRPINANTFGGEVTMPILINDTPGFALDGGKELVWCPFMVNTTWRTVGYLYYNDETDYTCVNLAEDAEVGMDVDMGNSSNGSAWGVNALGIYHMNEGGDALLVDSSIYNRSCVGPAASNATSTAGQIGKGMDFESSVNDYYTCEDIDSYTTDLTMMAWFNAESITATSHILGKYDAVYTSYILLLSSGGLLIDFRRVTEKCELISTTFVSTEIWYHIAVVLNSTDCVLYVNGGVNVTDPSVGNIQPTGKPFTIGANANDGSDPFDGIIDEVRWYNKSLSPDEIQAFYNNTIGTHNFSELGAEETGVGTGLTFAFSTPANNTYTSNNYIEVNAISSENATSCLLEWDDSSPSNETMTIVNADDVTTCSLNMTGLSDGEYLFIVYGDLIAIGINATGQRNVTIDTTDPTVTIVEPSVEKSTQFYTNYTASDTNLDSCWYSLDSGTNTTIASCANAFIDASTSGTHSIEIYANDTTGNIGGTTKSFIVLLFNLNVYNATGNGTITDWHVYLLNGSADNNSQFTNNNTLTLNISDIPTGTDVEMTIWKSGHGNATFNLSIDGTANLIYERHIIGDNFFVTLLPPNSSIRFADEEFTLNISLPNYAEGNGSIWYTLNGSLPYTLGCNNCTGFSRTISFAPGSNAIFGLINNSQHYLGANNENKSHNITIFNSKYNISFFDEMTNNSINLSTDKNGTLEFFCSDRTIIQAITGTLHEFILNCTGDLKIIKFKLFDPKGDHYRELIPTFRIGNLTFYMINTTPADITVNKVTFAVTDASFKYQAGIMHFKKIILGEGQKDIIDTIIGSDGKVYANLIGGETYTLSVESADGTNSKTLGEYTAPDATTTSQSLTIIDVRFIPTTYNYIGTDISWEMQFNTSMGKIYFYWNDSTGQTNRIQFWIYNITNVTARTQMYYDSVSGQSNHLFQWDYVTNGNENDTYLGYFEVDHAIHGIITESRPLAKGGIFFQWLGNIGAWYHIFSVFIIVFVASLFGAKSAPIGAVILAIIAGFLFYIEWLPSIMAGAVRLTDLLMLTLIALSILAMFIIKRRRT